MARVLHRLGPDELSEAWEYFGPANGASSLEQMLSRISLYRAIIRAVKPVTG